MFFQSYKHRLSYLKWQNKELQDKISGLQRQIRLNETEIKRIEANKKPTGLKRGDNQDGNKIW